MDVHKFGNFIAETRRQKHMTQAELAGHLHVTDKAVSRWERGLGFPDVSTLAPLADALGVSIIELMQSHRLEEPELCEADEALNDAVQLARQQAADAQSDLMIAVSCIFLFVLILAELGPGAIFQTFMPCGSLAVAAVCWRYFRRAESGREKTYFRAALYGSIGLFISSIFWLLPDSVLYRYQPLVYLSVFILIFLSGIKSLVQSIRGHHTEQRPYRYVSAVILVLSLLICVVCIHREAQSLLTAPRQEQEQAVQQYASLLVLQDCGIEEEQLTACLQDDTSDESSIDAHAIAFRYQDGGKEQLYGYRILMNKSGFVVLERGSELGQEIAAYAGTK